MSSSSVKSASAIALNDAEKFSAWLSTKIAPITLKERLTLLNSCWQWGIKEGILETNPWAELVGRVKVPPKQLCKPFTKGEIGAIIQGFRNDGYYHRYADYVEFLFSTVTLTPSLQTMLLRRRPAKPDPDELVFTSPKGGAIDDCNFRNRAWKTVLTRLEIDYRKPYTSRHTLISHALDLGMTPTRSQSRKPSSVTVSTLYCQFRG